MAEMAQMSGVEVRTIQKWCNEKHGFNNRTFKQYARINKTQEDLIIGNLLGDGHIDKRPTQPNFIVSHAENQKDYLYWEFDILKNLCYSTPSYHPPYIKDFYGKDYVCQGYYRFNTRIIEALIPYREMSISDLILSLNEFSFCVFILDDGFRSTSNWSICVAEFSESDKKIFCNICFERFGLNCSIKKDDRYILFDSSSSRMIDEMILKNIPKELDIVKYKITNNNISKGINYLYINDDGNKIGLSTYCRKTGWAKYKKIKHYMETNNINEISVIEMNLLLERR